MRRAGCSKRLTLLFSARGDDTPIHRTGGGDVDLAKQARPVHSPVADRSGRAALNEDIRLSVAIEIDRGDHIPFRHNGIENGSLRGEGSLAFDEAVGDASGALVL